MKRPSPPAVRDLSSWELASILGSAMGLPAMVVGGKIANQFGPGVAVVSVLIGNLILWVVGLGIVSMSRSRNDAIQNVRGYLEKISGIGATFFLSLVFLIWYTIQIKGASEAISSSSAIGLLFLKNIDIWFGLLLGILAGLLSIGGIKLISRVCVIGLPLLIAFTVYMILASNHSVSFDATWGFSIFGTLSIMIVWLPGMVNLPTFFRHSCSRADAFFSLSLITFFHIFFEIASILAGFDEPSQISKYFVGSNSFFYFAWLLLFIVLFYLCINLVNIYFASAGWDAIILSYQGPLKFVIIGLLGTGVYIILQLLSPFLSSPMVYLENTITSFISILGVVLLIDYLISVVVKHRPRFFEKFWSSICWLIGCLTVIQVYNTFGQSYALGAGISASLLAFLIVIFVEETIWSIKNLN